MVEKTDQQSQGNSNNSPLQHQPAGVGGSKQYKKMASNRKSVGNSADKVFVSRRWGKE